MLSKKFKKILLVSPDLSLNQLFKLPAGNAACQVYNVTACNKVFSSLFDKQPDAIVFDYDHLDKDAENTLRRIRSNSFYNKLKIYCYRNEANENIDAFLKVLGVDNLIYKTDLDKFSHVSTTFNPVNVLKYISLNVNVALK